MSVRRVLVVALVLLALSGVGCSENSESVVDQTPAGSFSASSLVYVVAGSGTEIELHSIQLANKQDSLLHRLDASYARDSLPSNFNQFVDGAVSGTGTRVTYAYAPGSVQDEYRYQQVDTRSGESAEFRFPFNSFLSPTGNLVAFSDEVIGQGTCGSDDSPTFYEPPMWNIHTLQGKTISELSGPELFGEPRWQAEDRLLFEWRAFGCMEPRSDDTPSSPSGSVSGRTTEETVAMVTARPAGSGV